MQKVALIILLLGVLCLGYYMVVFEPNNIKIERRVIAMKNLPQPFNGTKIVHLSDFHSLWFGSREKKVLKILEELKPDFIFITGDFVDPVTEMITDRDLSSVKIFWQELGKKYKNRIFGVLGNHDNKLIGDCLKMSGIEILDNENQKIFAPHFFKEKEAEFIYLIGVNDSSTGHNDLSKAIKGIEPDIPKILLAHAADNVIDEAIRKKIGLVLVGHTHGGQVNIPVLGKLLQPLSEYGRKYTSGLFKIENTYLYVNRGIGTSLFPIRFNCPPEITLIELRSKPH